MRRAAQYTGVALVAAVLMTGCGSGGDKKSADEPSASTPSGTGGDSPATGAPGHYDGVYGARSDDGMVGMTITQGKAIVYANNGKRACTGTVDEKDRPAKLALKCADGDTERTAGTVDSSDGKTLVVSWAAGRKDTFTRSGDPVPLPSPKKLGG
ncbi:hypothetical protein [Streptomyces sp. NPDC051162]|uniref:hypothetical protein n=1 Tax=unclassified Streptomyces TaxID=2593676 RepID=UPI003426802E